MTRLLAGVLVVVASGCNCTPACPALPDAGVASPQPWGGPCLQQRDCQSGLTCLPYLTGLSICSYACSTSNQCHGGLCVVDGDAGFCMKPCELDGGCETGDLYSRCGTGACIPLTCTFGAKNQCPDEFSCVGAQCLETSESIGITSGFCRGVMQ